MLSLPNIYFVFYRLEYMGSIEATDPGVNQHVVADVGEAIVL